MHLTRRGFLAALAAVPGVGRLVPAPVVVEEYSRVVDRNVWRHEALPDFFYNIEARDFVVPLHVSKGQA